MSRATELAARLQHLAPEGQRDLLAELFLDAGVFFGHGTGTAPDEAAWLVDAATRRADGSAADTTAVWLAEMALRRVDERLPLAYLLNEAWFCDLCFYVDERVLVPRSPLAELINAGFRPWHAGKPGRLLDLGTGSGCIGIAAYLCGAAQSVDASDISVDALAVAAINVERFGVQRAVRLVQSDLFDGLTDERYDVIVANPPYVPAESMAYLPPEYGHEPASALVAGPDGLDFAVRILAGAGRHLATDGLLLLELGEAAPHLQTRFPECEFYWPEFARGGEGVLAISAEQVREYWP